MQLCFMYMEIYCNIWTLNIHIGVNTVHEPRSKPNFAQFHMTKTSIAIYSREQLRKLRMHDKPPREISYTKLTPVLLWLQ